ncbi:tetratricopeptide repeat protein [Nonomuraea sp. NPDC003709]|uniref:tetratricopeptide repeat protein n=1 Tax=Nonomuraea sp. NPDC003709 TaxID=3154450 RepID=UPI0033B73DDD
MTTPNPPPHAREAFSSAQEMAQEVIALFVEVVVERHRLLDADHPDTLSSQGLLAGVLESTGHTQDAIALHEVTLACRQRLLGADHPDTLSSPNDLARVLAATGAKDQAVALYRGTPAVCEEAFSRDQANSLASLNQAREQRKPWWRRVILR